MLKLTREISIGEPKNVENITFFTINLYNARKLDGNPYLYSQRGWQIDVQSRLVRLVPMNISVTSGFSCQSTGQDVREREERVEASRGEGGDSVASMYRDVWPDELSTWSDPGCRRLREFPPSTVVTSPFSVQPSNDRF